MAYRLASVALALLLFAGCGGSTDPEAPASGPQTLYVCAPLDWSRTNVLPTEAALRAAAIDAASRGVSVYFLPGGRRQGPSADAFPRLEVEGPGSSGPESRVFVLRTKEGGIAQVADADFSRGSWREVKTSVAAAAAGIIAGLERELGLPPAGASTLSEPERACLDAAFGDLCRDGPSRLLEASAAIDRVLSGHSTNAQALTAACWPSCMAASLDFYGYFQHRSRFLAVPLGWWTAAERAGARGPEAELTEAWVALVCGFPDEARAIVAQLDAPAALAPLAAALETFITRDWRTRAGGEAACATAIEQLAWLWALQECQLVTPHLDAISSILAERQHPAFAAVYDYQSVEGGHALTVPGLALAMDQVFGLVGGLGIASAQERQSVDALLPSRLKDEGGEIPLEKWVAHFAGGSERGDGAGVFRAAQSVLASAANAPDGPLSHREGAPAWQSMSPWAHAQASGGILYRAIERRAFFLARTWAVHGRAAAFTKEAAGGLGGADAPGLFFAVAASFVAGNTEAASEDLRALMNLEMGRCEAALWHVCGEWADAKGLEEAVRARWFITHHPCGAWQWELLASRAPRESKARMYRDWYAAAAASDSCSKVRGDAALLEGADEARVLAIARAMPYQYRMTRRMSEAAAAAGQHRLAEELLQMGIEAAPDFILNYRDLARLYRSLERAEDAIEVLERGLARAPRSITADACNAMLAELLIATGRGEEAVEGGRAATGGFSRGGLEAYGWALDRAGRQEEALEVFKATAERYPTAAYNYLVYAQLAGRPDGEIEEAARRLAARSARTPLAPYIAAPLAMYGRFGLAADLLKTTLAVEDASLDGLYWGDHYLMKDEYEEAASHYHRALSEGFFARHGRYGGEIGATRAMIAMCLAGDEGGKWMIREWFEWYSDAAEGSRPLFAYMRGEASREEALAMPGAGAAITLHLSWLFAAESEAVGEADEAAKWYARAAGEHASEYSYAGCFAREKLKR